MDKNVNMPKVSVFMPVYNCEKFVSQAIQSILDQTFSDFEFLIIDDGSTDRSAKIIKSFNDKRIRYIKNERNLGLRETLNKGFNLCQSEYIARIDADDIAYTTRLKKQVDFMNKYKNCVLLGTATSIINAESKPIGVVWKSNLGPEELPIALLFNNRFTHPSVMIRKSALPEPVFRSNLTPAEDYDLWCQLAKRGQIANLPNILTKYRIHGKNISQTKAKEKDDAVRKIITEQLAKLGINPTETEYKIHRTNFIADYENMDEIFNLRESWLLKLVDTNNKTSVYDKKIFARVTAKMWLVSCQSNIKKYPDAWKRFKDSPLSNYLEWHKDWQGLLKFRLKSII